MWWLMAGGGYDCWVETVRPRGREGETVRLRERERNSETRKRMKKNKNKKGIKNYKRNNF